MGYTITIETHDDSESRYLYDIIDGYFANINPSAQDYIKYMSNNPKTHPYSPDDVVEGISITFSTLPTEALAFLFNVGRCSVMSLQTRLFYDDEEIKDRSIRWPKDNRKMLRFLNSTLYKKEMETIEYFEKEVYDQIRDNL